MVMLPVSSNHNKVISLELKTEIDEKLKKQGIHLAKLTGVEEISKPFNYSLLLFFSENDKAEQHALIEKLINTAVTVEINSFTDSHRDTATVEKRYINGIVVEAIRQSNGLIELHLVPKMQFLACQQSRRIFQNKTPADIIKTILDKNGCAYEMTAIQTKLFKDKSFMPFCAQYDETDFDFLSRLLELLGIFYFFEHKEGQHTLKLADNSGIYKAETTLWECAHAIKDTFFIDKWVVRSSGFGNSKFSLKAHNAESPDTVLFNTLDSTLESKKSLQTEAINYLNLGNNETALKELNKVRMEADLAKTYIATAITPSIALQIAHSYTLNKNGYFTDEKCRSYVVTQLIFNISDTNIAQHNTSLSLNFNDGPICTFKAIPADKVYRTERLSPMPVISGVHRAEVLADDVLDTDSEGKNRIRVKLMWEAADSDTKNTCYIWSNPFGVIRKGVKVTVCFPDGNPYQIPILNNIIADGATKTANDEKHQTVFMAPEGNTANTGKHNMLVFDDSEGEAKTMKFMAPGHKEIIVEKGNDKTLVKTGDYEISIEKGQVVIRAKGAISLEGEDIILKANNSIVLNAAKGDIIQQAMNIDLIAKTNLSLEAMAIASEAKTSNVVKGGTTASLEAGAAVSVKGGVSASVDGGPMTSVKGVMTTLG